MRDQSHAPPVEQLEMSTVPPSSMYREAIASSPTRTSALPVRDTIAPDPDGRGDSADCPDAPAEAESNFSVVDVSQEEQVNRQPEITTTVLAGAPNHSVPRSQPPRGQSSLDGEKDDSVSEG